MNMSLFRSLFCSDLIMKTNCNFLFHRIQPETHNDSFCKIMWPLRTAGKIFIFLVTMRSGAGTLSHRIETAVSSLHVGPDSGCLTENMGIYWFVEMESSCRSSFGQNCISEQCANNANMCHNRVGWRFTKSWRTSQKALFNPYWQHSFVLS